MKMLTVCRLHHENAYSVHVTSLKCLQCTRYIIKMFTVYRLHHEKYQKSRDTVLLRGMCDEIFFHYSNPSEPLTNSLTYFRIWSLSLKIRLHGVHCFKVSLIFSANRRCEPVPHAYRPKHFDIFTPICRVFSVTNSVHRNFPTCLPNYFGHLKSIASKKRTISKNSQLTH